jgi:hypothetical protein
MKGITKTTIFSINSKRKVSMRQDKETTKENKLKKENKVNLRNWFADGGHSVRMEIHVFSCTRHQTVSTSRNAGEAIIVHLITSKQPMRLDWIVIEIFVELIMCQHDY